MPVRRRRSTALAAAVATAAALGATALATVGTTTASAAEMPLEGYELTWGVKQSYRTYVGMFGTFATADGASQATGNGAFTFVDGASTYDTARPHRRPGLPGHAGERVQGARLRGDPHRRALRQQGRARSPPT
ncbi:HtaA domain-containing protein [Streptomyces sp. UP1A-1]|nr:HtaA domain-containing protein [Streptomyces sp. UP1A-1]